MRAFAWISSGVSAGRVALRPRGIADHAGEVPDEEGHLVPELLELAHLVEQHRVPEVQVGRRRIEARLHLQRRAALELLRPGPPSTSTSLVPRWSSAICSSKFI